MLRAPRQLLVGRFVRAMTRPLHEIDRAVEARPIDFDADAVAVAQPADGPAGERFGADVADARPRRDAREPRVGRKRDRLADVEILERRGDLVDLFHARAHRAAAGEHDHRARRDAVGSRGS